MAVTEMTLAEMAVIEKTDQEARFNAFVEKMIGEVAASYSTPLILVGDKLGLYRAMNGSGWMTSADLAERTGTDERYIREWLSANAAGELLEYDPRTRMFRMTEEQAMALAIEDSPIFVPGMYQGIASMIRDEPLITEAFRTGKGVGWHEHDSGLFHGTERLFRTSYRNHLVQEWIPSLEGAEEKLRKGALVADVGCGHGASTIIMAEAFPNSTFVGFDYHETSIEQARRRAEVAGVTDRVTFQTAAARDYPGRGYDLVAVFDALHDMGDPVGAASHIRRTLASDGAWMIVEPKAGDRLEDNLNPIGRIYYSASTMVCTPASKAQEVGLALGAQAGETRLREVAAQGGFHRFRRAAETPFNLVFEARA